MKLAAMEGIYHGNKGQEFIAVGILNPQKEYNDDQDPFSFKIGVPGVLSFLATRDIDGFVPGINDIIQGGYPTTNFAGDSIIALSAQEKMLRGRTAVAALGDYRSAREKDDSLAADSALQTLRGNYEYFGYGYIERAISEYTQCTYGILLIPHHDYPGWIFHSFLYRYSHS